MQETDCENYIKFVQILPNDPSRLVICGTYSLFRACLTVNVRKKYLVILLQYSPQFELMFMVITVSPFCAL